MADFLEKLSKAEAFIFDVDGVLTDGTVIVTEEGHMLRNMSIKDGFVLQLAVKLGIKIAIITGGNSKGVIKRLQGLGIQDVFAGVADKIHVLDQYLADNSINPEYCVYMGDDIPDLQIMNRVGLSTCPSNAATEVLEACAYVSPYEGGKGCVRDVIEKSLRLKGLWNPSEQGSW
jgi:3-deoxy-D-manno-octulosonate 8-phosphate phosphatase (KDO 8-P phosphatase)